MNKRLLQAGIEQLIKTQKRQFINQLTEYLYDKDEIIDYLFDGPLPIDDEIKAKAVAFIKSELPSPDYFKELINIKTGFSYSTQVVYIVECKVSRFYEVNAKSYYQGFESPSDEHPIEKIENKQFVITPKDLQ